MTIRAPSVKALTTQLHITEDEANTVRGLIKGTVDPETVEATEGWVRQCHHRPPDSDLILHAIDATLNTHGVEYIGGGPQDTWDWRPDYEYCNTGDSYAATIIRNNETGAYFIGDWGTIAERMPRGEE